MILYHGSNQQITEIDLSKSKPGKDFGKGFYLSDNFEQAYELASYKTEQLGGDPVVSKFNFNPDELSNTNLKIKIFKDYSLEWVDFIIANRKGQEEVEKFDFVYGPIANDRVGRQLRRFFDNDIDKNELLERLKYMKGITFQYYFGTEKAINFLEPLS